MTTGQRMKNKRKEIGLSAEKVAELLGVSPATIYRYENGDIDKVPGDKLGPIAKALQTTPAFLMGWEEDVVAPLLPPNIRPIRKVYYVPRIGRIACGTPILAEENILGQVLLPDGVKADFALDCAGDSMIEACIGDGDTVFIRSQPEVENGEIAAVLIGEEATLKRVYLNGSVLTLMPANREHVPLSYTKDEMDSVRILGKATAVLKLL